MPIDPINIGAQHGLGTAFDQQGKIDEAIAAIRGAIANTPNNAALHGQLGHLLNRRGHWEGAQAAFHAALAIDPKKIGAQHGLGTALDRQGKTGEAITAIRGAIVNTPNNAALHGQLGHLLNRQGHWEDAQAAFQAALAIDPKTIGAHGGLGTALDWQGKTGEAIAVIRDAIANTPNNAALHDQLGYLLNRQGHWEDALAAFQAARELLNDAERRLSASPAQSLEQILSVKRALAENAMSRGAWAEAVDRWESVRAAFPSDITSYVRGADALLGLGRRADCVHLIAEAFSRFPESLTVARRHARDAVAARQWDKAAERWANVRCKFPGEVAGYAEGSQVLINMGRLPEARAILDEAVTKFPESPMLKIIRMELMLDSANWHEINVQWCDLRGQAFPKPRNFYRLSWLLYIQKPPGAASSNFFETLFSEPRAPDWHWKPEVLERLWWLFWFDRHNFRVVRSDVLLWLEAKAWEDLPPVARVVGVALGLPIDDERLASLMGQYFSTPARSLVSFVLEPRLANFTRGNKDQCPGVLRQYINCILSRGHFDRIDLKAAETLYNALMFSYFYSGNFSEIKGSVWAIIENFDTTMLQGNVRNILSAIASICTSSPSPVARIAVPRATEGFPARRRLKIALCVGGQLRGYKTASRTWERLRLGDHDVTTFVHTWKNIGRKVPFGIAAAANRSFSGEFLKVYLELYKTHDHAVMLWRYLTLFEYLRTGQHISEAELREWYRTEHVIIEDETEPPFRDFTNAMKLHHKIEGAYKMTLSSGDFDLYIKIRPDLSIEGSSEEFAWADVLNTSIERNVIFCDFAPRISANHFFVIGDLFAVGAKSGMDVYSRTWSFSHAAIANKVYGFPPHFFFHVNLAYSTLYQGVRVERLPGVQFGAVSDTGVVRPEQIRRLLLADIGSQPRDTSDLLLLNAVEADMGDPTS